MGRISISMMLLAAIAASGCSRSSNALSGVNTQSPPQALPSVPSGQVQSSQLDPISGELGQPGNPYGPNAANPQALPQNTTAGDAGTLSTNTDTASLTPDPAVSTKPLKHEELQGTWQVLSDSSECRVFLAFTKWDGGYRFGKKRCLSPEISSATAWDVKGSQVVLVDGGGNTVARLYSSGNDRYDGKTSSGQPISFSR